jgi:anti-anti-sigma factor
MFLRMQLTLKTERMGRVMLIRCSGRIVTGIETKTLQEEIDKHTLETKKFVLHLAEVKYVDSGGLGAMVRHAGVLRAHHGDLKLCEMSPFVQQVLQATNLMKVFQTYATEKEAVDAFLEGPAHHAASSGSGGKIICVDTSKDLLAYLNVLLKRSGYEVITAHNLSDAKRLAKATSPNVVVCGPGFHADEFALEGLRHAAPQAEFLMLASDFSTTDASDAGKDLVDRLSVIFNSAKS